MTIAWIGIILMIVILLAVVTIMRRSKPPDTDNPQGPMGRCTTQDDWLTGKEWPESQTEKFMYRYRNVEGWAEMNHQDLIEEAHRQRTFDAELNSIYERITKKE